MCACPLWWELEQRCECWCLVLVLELRVVGHECERRRAAGKEGGAIMKPIVYAEIPEFDQATQAVFQAVLVDMGDHIYVGVVVVDLPEQGELLS